MTLPICSQQGQQPTTLEFHALSTLPPILFHDLFAEAMLACGGWILERRELPDEAASYLIEFECGHSLEVYAALVSLGIHLSRNAHLSLTGLCQCARQGACAKLMPTARIRLTVQTTALLPVGHLRQTESCAK